MRSVHKLSQDFDKMNKIQSMMDMNWKEMEFFYYRTIVPSKQFIIEEVGNG